VTVYTVGYGSLNRWDFERLLERHNIHLIVDVRAKPWSRWNPDFNRAQLEKRLGDRYKWAGAYLGNWHGMDPKRHPTPIRQTEKFRIGIDRIKELATGEDRIAVMCAEKDYRECHRHLDVGRALVEDGVEIIHLLHDGSQVRIVDPGIFEEAPEQAALF